MKALNAIYHNPAIVWYKVGMHKKEILLDGSSVVIKNKLDLLPFKERVLCGERKKSIR